MKIKISLLSNKFLGKELFARELYDFFNNNEVIFPAKFGNFEPLKDEFPNSFDEFMRYWYDDKFKNINTILWEGGKYKDNSGLFEYSKVKGSPSFNTLSFSLNTRNTAQFKEVTKFLNNLVCFFDFNQFIYGRISLLEEYDKYNILKDTDFYYNKRGEKVFFDDGGTCPILPVGLDIKKHIPGIYWKTLFGKVYVEWIGKEKILQTPCYEVRELDNGSVELQAYEKPEEYNTDAAIQQVKEIKDYLGDDRFFDIFDIDRKTRAPDIDVSEIII